MTTRLALWELEKKKTSDQYITNPLLRMVGEDTNLFMMYRDWEDLRPFLVDRETGCQVQDAAIGCALRHSSAFLRKLKISFIPLRKAAKKTFFKKTWS